MQFETDSIAQLHIQHNLDSPVCEVACNDLIKQTLPDKFAGSF